MNKLITAIISSVATIGVAVGAVAVVDNIPATKDKINISYGKTDIVGNNNKTKVDYETLIAKIINDNKEKEDQIERLSASIDSINSQIEVLQSDNSAKDVQISELEVDNSNKVAEISALNASIEENNQRIAELEQSEEDKSAEIAELQADNESKDSQISSLTATINSNNATISELESAKESNEATILDLNSSISEKELEISSLQIQLNTSNETISQLQSEINNYETLLENYAIVTYVSGNYETVVLYEKGSIADYHKSFPVGLISGLSFDSAGTDLVPDDYVVQNGDILYMVKCTNPPVVEISLDFSSDDLVSDSSFEFLTAKITDFGFKTTSVFEFNGQKYALGSSKSGYYYFYITGFKYLTVDDGVEHEVTLETIESNDWKSGVISSVIHKDIEGVLSLRFNFYFTEDGSKPSTVKVVLLNEDGSISDSIAHITSLNFLLMCKDDLASYS